MRSILAEIVLVFITAMVCTVLVILSPLDRRGRWVEGIARWWGHCVFALSGISVSGSPVLPGNGPYILMANHESYLDPPLLIWQIPLKLRFVAKVELFYIPLFGQAMWVVGHIFVNRGNHEKAVRSLKRAAAKVRAGTSVIVFPEGTRAGAGAGELLPFKKGGFMLAIESGIPILPVGIAGSGSCLRKGSLRLRPGPIFYRIGEPVPTAGLTPADRDRLMAEVRRVIEDLRRKARG